MRRYVYRNSITGRYCSKRHAERHPDTTERERANVVKAAVIAVRRVVGR
jgi:hypothetical protein